MSPYIEGFEKTYDTLPQAIRAILSMPRRSAQLENEETGQKVRVKALGSIGEVSHVVHPQEPTFEGETPTFILETGFSSTTVTRFSERPFLRLVANQLKRFTKGNSILITDSQGNEQFI